MTGRGRRDSEGPNPRQVLHQRTVRAVCGWIADPAVRHAAQSEWWRSGVEAALQPLEAAVGPLDQRGVCWLLAHSLKAEMWPPEDAEWKDTYVPPPWASHSAVPLAADALLKVTTTLALVLSKAGVGLDPGSLADRLVLAQLVALDCDWGDPDRLVEGLNVGAVGTVRSDGRATFPDRHATDAETRALEVLRRPLLPPLRIPYPERQGTYDGALRRILADRPTVTAPAIVKALAAKPVESWVSELQPYYTDQTDQNRDDFRRTVDRALRRLRAK